MKPLLIVSAACEAGIGLGLLAVPSVVAQILLGAPLDLPVALTVARVAGAALLALGIACWLAGFDPQSCAARGVVSAMVIYNVGTALVLGIAALGSQLGGIGLWPAVLLHAAMTLWCLWVLLGKQSGTARAS